MNVCSANRSAVLLLLAHDCSIRLFRFRSKGWTSHRLAVEKWREQGSGNRDQDARFNCILVAGGEDGAGCWVQQFTFLAREDFFDGGKKRP